MFSTESRGEPLRVAIVGAGPAGFYSAEQLLGQQDRLVEVDLFDRLPTPFGLVRHGVAPDHPGVKAVTRSFDKTAAHPRFRFFGNVEIGRHVTVADLSACYHQILFCTGAGSDRRLSIPGEELAGSRSATEFVGWYNGHPDFSSLHVDLQQERVVIVGAGNVALDIARILLRPPAELESTDIAVHALEELRRSRVREVFLLARRGPAQAAFTIPELREIGELQNVDVVADSAETALDPLSRAELDRMPDRRTSAKVEILQAFSTRRAVGNPRRLVLRFLVSPVELIGAGGHVAGLRLVHNRLAPTRTGTLRAYPTDRFETLPAGLVIHSVGFRGLAIPGVPFNDDIGVIWNEKGRVLDGETRRPVRGLYVAGWAKRGATGVIGTNGPDAAETVRMMLMDAAAGLHLQPAMPAGAVARSLIHQHQPDAVSFEEWLQLDQIEIARGREANRPRIKLTSREEMLSALGRRRSACHAWSEESHKASP